MKYRRIVIVALLLVLLPASAYWFLLYTEAGARWLLGLARDATGDALSYESVSGSIGRGLALDAPGFTSDGLVAASDELSLEASLSLLPPAIDVATVTIDALTVDVTGTAEPSGAPVDVAGVLEALRLPVRLNVESLIARDVELRDSGAAVARADRVELALHWHDRIKLIEFIIDGGDEFDASGDVSIELEAPFIVSANVDAAAAGSLTGLPEALQGTLGVAGTLEALDVELVENNTGLELEGRLESILDRFAWDIDARMREFGIDEAAGIRVDNARLSSVGSPGHYEFATALSVTGLLDETPARIEAGASGSTTGLDIDEVRVSHPAAELEASGRLDFPLDFRGSVTIGKLLLNQWASELGELHVVTGESKLAVTLDRLSLDGGRFAVAGAPVGVDVGASFDFDTGDMGATLAWRDLRWPLFGDSVQIESDAGSARLSGSLDAWRVELSAGLSAPDIASGRLGATGEGTRQSAAFEITDGEVFGGLVDGSARVDWADGLSWSGEATVRGLRTAAILPAYPGILTLRARVSSAADATGADIEIVDLRGTLLDEPLSGGGRISVSATDLAARDFRLSHGEASLSLDGELYAGAGLEFDLRVPDLALYRPAFAGDLDVAGRISLKHDAPLLALVGSSRGIRISQFEVGSVDLQTTENDGGGIDLTIRADELEYDARRVDHIALEAVLNPDRQRVALEMTPLGNRVEIVAGGSMSEPGTLAGFPWIGAVEEFSLVTRDGEGGSLDAPVAVELSPDKVLIQDMCLTGERRGRLCTSLDFDRAAGLELTAGIGGVPMDVLNAFLQTGLEFEQTVSGTLRWSARNSTPPSGGAELRFSAGQLKSARFPDLDLRTGQGGIGFEVLDGHLLSAHLELPLGTDGFIDGQLRIEDIDLGAASPLAGTLNARTKDVDVFAVLLPDIDGASGSLEANLELTGTVGQPLVLGTATLRDGEINYFPLGLTLTGMNLNGRFDEDRRVALDGTFRAGEGRGEIVTMTDGAYDEEPGVHVSIRGSGLSLVELPDISAVADADLQLDYRNRRLDVAGSIDIPRARIRPVDLTTNRVDESADVVIVAGTFPDEGDEVDEKSRLAVHGKLALGVGDDVQVILDVARASIDGRADFEWSGDPIPIGRGRYSINGTVQAFGQVLDISEGLVSFPDVPATDPLLSIRATREIFGNTQIKRAGILVQGTARRPTVNAYTDPITTEERALTLLVTGNDFDMAQGVGAIDFGTYVAPRLFLSYGVGVFERENVISARYDLGRGFGIRTTSGSRESGVDLTYRLER